MWLINAFLSAIFAGVTAVLSKMGLEDMSSHYVTALRTSVVLIFTWLMVWVSGSDFSGLNAQNLLFIVLSGIATGAMMMFGTYLMISKPKQKATNNYWYLYALGSAFFASLTAILAKIGISNVDSQTVTALRTIVVVMMAWLVVRVSHSYQPLSMIHKKHAFFIVLSGVATGLSWLCYFEALKDGPASVVVPIDKLSIVVSILFAYFILHEKQSRKTLIGLICIVVSTLLLII